MVAERLIQHRDADIDIVDLFDRRFDQLALTQDVRRPDLPALESGIEQVEHRAVGLKLLHQDTPLSPDTGQPIPSERHFPAQTQGARLKKLRLRVGAEGLRIGKRVQASPKIQLLGRSQAKLDRRLALTPTIDARFSAFTATAQLQFRP